MCGIAGIISKSDSSVNLAEKIALMCHAIKHRGPDGEGFMLVAENKAVSYSGSVKVKNSEDGFPQLPRLQLPEKVPGATLALGHRRLSIIDLSVAGHQPMCDFQKNLWITYNGEIYNYLELRKELETLGHLFFSHSDTEVILAAYKQWGTKCIHKFNGMWSFFIYDHAAATGFASRDRLGVKPFYYLNTGANFCFASEQKAFIKSGLVKAGYSDKALAAYLVYGALERESDNFFTGIQELMPGNNLIYDFKTHIFRIEKYYSITDSVSSFNENLSEAELVKKISGDFRESVRLRMRSDVEVGTCLSGGIDSSALAVTMKEFGSEHLHCFTSIFSKEKNNEDRFASLVASKIGAYHHKIEPDHESFMREADDLIYSQDVPIWSTSTYAQHKVMQLAKQSGIKVVLDGQGADELFAGYHHHLVARWNYLNGAGKFRSFLADLQQSVKTIPDPFTFYVKEKFKGQYDLTKRRNGIFLSDSLLQQVKKEDRLRYFSSVNLQLMHDISYSRLKIFLKCEDRCGMWHGVESRTPFSDDIHLINTAFSFPGERKIKNGVLKHLLREAVKDQLPSEIYTRYDKTGFETPMRSWMQALKYRMLEEIEACNFNFLKSGALSQWDFNDEHQLNLFFKLFVLARWQKVFKT